MPTRRKAGKGRVVFTIEGLGDVQRSLNSLPENVQKRVLRAAIKRSLKPVYDATLEEAPIGMTSQLISAVRIKAARRRRRDRVALYVTVGQGDFKGDTYYAAMVEYGHAIRDVPRGAEVGRVPADPFMERAFDRTKDKAKADAIEEIKKGTLRQIKSLAKKADTL